MSEIRHYKIGLYKFAILISFIMCLSFSVYNYVGPYMFYILSFFVIIDFIIIRKVKKRGLRQLFVIALYIVIDTTYLQGSLSIYGIFRYLIIFLSAFLFERVNFDTKVWKYGFALGMIYLAVYLLNYKHILNEFSIQKQSTGGIQGVSMINLNVPCLMVFVCQLFMIFYCKSEKKKKEKVITLIATFFSVLMSVVFDCRVTIVTSILAYIFLELVPIHILMNKRLILWTLISIFVGGILFPLVDVLLFYNKTLSAMELAFSGRELIWSNYFKEIGSQPLALLFGLGGRYRLLISSNGLTMHNSFLEFMFSLGLVGVLLYLFTAYKIISSAFDNGINEIRIYYIVSYLILLIFAFMNTAIQREYLLIFFSLFLGLSNNRTNEKNKTEKPKSAYC